MSTSSLFSTGTSSGSGSNPVPEKQDKEPITNNQQEKKQEEKKQSPPLSHNKSSFSHGKRKNEGKDSGETKVIIDYYFSKRMKEEYKQEFDNSWRDPTEEQKQAWIQLNENKWIREAFLRRVNNQGYFDFAAFLNRFMDKKRLQKRRCSFCSSPCLYVLFPHGDQECGSMSATIQVDYCCEKHAAFYSGSEEQHHIVLYSVKEKKCFGLATCSQEQYEYSRTQWKKRKY